MSVSFDIVLSTKITKFVQFKDVGTIPPMGQNWDMELGDSDDSAVSNISQKQWLHDHSAQALLDRLHDRKWMESRQARKLSSNDYNLINNNNKANENHCANIISDPFLDGIATALENFTNNQEKQAQIVQSIKKSTGV